MKNNTIENKLHWLYLAGFCIILALPILTFPPFFFPPDFAKTIIFRSIMAIMLFGLLWGKLNTSNLSEVFKNKIIWALGGFFAVFLMATIFSVDQNFSLWGSPYRGGGFVSFAFYFVFAILAFLLLKKKDWQKAWLVAISTGILVSFVAIFQYYGLFNSIFVHITSGPFSTLGNSILLGIYLLLLLFPAVSFAIKETNKNLRIFYIFSALLFLYVIFISGSRAAYFGVVIGILYFLLSYPKKIKTLKIYLGVFILAILVAVLYFNSNLANIKTFQNNRIFQTLENRLSIKRAFDNERYKAWQIVIKEIQDKPILGWGPENIAVGFDKNFDPKIVSSPWWDKAHNTILQTGAEAGILGIVSYLALFVVLFWQLQKYKKENNALIICGLQATLIGYFVANFFSFDAYSTYLIFFFIVAYSLHLATSEPVITSQQIKQSKIIKKIVLGISFLALLFFIWQYNILPFFINANINKANTLAGQKDCARAISLLENQLQKHSFLDSYLIMNYVGVTKTCTQYYPDNNLSYIKRDLQLLGEGAEIQPLYTRYWLYLGSYTNILATEEKDAVAKAGLLKKSGEYLDKALELGPKHQETIIEQAKTAMASGDYKKMQSYCESCIALNSDTGSCYFYLALSKIYQKDNIEAQKNLQIAGEKNFNINLKENKNQLINAYGASADYQNLAIIYEKMISENPKVAQYHSSLAFFYKQLGRYAQARAEALKVLELSPESKPNVDAFLKTLP